MNALARAVHGLMTGEEAPHLADLSPPEQVALTDLRSLLCLPPQDLADFLAQGQQPIDWWNPYDLPAIEPSVDSEC